MMTGTDPAKIAKVILGPEDMIVVSAGLWCDQCERRLSSTAVTTLAHLVQVAYAHRCGR